jgi:hypothetical protein
VGPGLSSDWQSILAFVVFAFRIVLARVLTAFTASSLVRIIFNSTWLNVHDKRSAVLFIKETSLQWPSNSNCALLACLVVWLACLMTCVQ